MTARLVEKREGHDTARLLDGSELIIGRSSECGMQIADGLISSRHCRIYRDANAWWIADLGSVNGTFLNGSLISGARKLASGDRIRLGPEHMGLFEATFVDDTARRDDRADMTIDPSAHGGFLGGQVKLVTDLAAARARAERLERRVAELEAEVARLTAELTALRSR